jgi:hypothetical protein
VSHRDILGRRESLKRERVPPIQGAVVALLFYNMKTGFICPNLPGHINPMSALARHPQARGHDLVFLYSAGAAGLPSIYDSNEQPSHS